MITDLRVGDPGMVGPYRLVGRLGGGGMGQVYLARSPGGRTVAVKVIRPEHAADEDFRARFGREAAAAKNVSGVFTAAVIDADPRAALPWLATAYVPGPSLAEAVETQGPLPAASVLALAAGLAEGLQAIHAAGLVHRDLKPSNVLLAADGPRVIDFGISAARESSRLTQAGYLMGSPGFLSPEQTMGDVGSELSDVFSLGAVLAFAATGAGPFGDGPTLAAVLFRVVNDQPNLSGVPEPLLPLIRPCLARAAENRPTTGELLGLLSAWLPGGADAFAPEWLPVGVSAKIHGYSPTATHLNAALPVNAGSPTMDVAMGQPFTVPRPRTPATGASPAGAWPPGPGWYPGPGGRRRPGRRAALLGGVAVLAAGGAAAAVLAVHLSPSPIVINRAAASQAAVASSATGSSATGSTAPAAREPASGNVPAGPATALATAPSAAAPSAAAPPAAVLPATAPPATAPATAPPATAPPATAPATTAPPTAPPATAPAATAPPTAPPATAPPATAPPTAPPATAPVATAPATAPPAATPPATPPETPAGQTEQQQAKQLAALLTESTQDRSAVVNAVTDVKNCGDPSADEQTFNEAANSRGSLTSQLESTDTSALPSSMIQDLIGAWQASAQADEDFSSWAADEARSCTPGGTDPNYQAASGPDTDAGRGKQAFVAAWDPIASKYGLPPYQWNQL